VAGRGYWEHTQAEVDYLNEASPVPVLVKGEPELPGEITYVMFGRKRHRR
jgi:hypothetical protein